MTTVRLMTGVEGSRVRDNYNWYIGRGKSDQNDTAQRLQGGDERRPLQSNQQYPCDQRNEFLTPATGRGESAQNYDGRRRRLAPPPLAVSLQGLGIDQLVRNFNRHQVLANLNLSAHAKLQTLCEPPLRYAAIA